MDDTQSSARTRHASLNIGAGESPDGIHYNGSHSESGAGITSEWSWTLTGEKASP